MTELLRPRRTGAAPPRRFDHAAARRLRDDGLTYATIAERMGVSAPAVRRAVNDDARRQETIQHRDRAKRPCNGGCGRLAWHTSHTSGYCRKCSARRRNTPPVHGTESCYTKGCRRPECRAASTAAHYLRRRRKRIREITGRPLPADGSWPKGCPLRVYVWVVDKTTGDAMPRVEARMLATVRGHVDWAMMQRRFREETPAEVEARLLEELEAPTRKEQVMDHDQLREQALASCDHPELLDVAAHQVAVALRAGLPAETCFGPGNGTRYCWLFVPIEPSVVIDTILNGGNAESRSVGHGGVWVGTLLPPTHIYPLQLIGRTEPPAPGYLAEKWFPERGVTEDTFIFERFLRLVGQETALTVAR